MATVKQDDERHRRGDAEHLRRVLCIAYYYPPAGGAGVQRPLKFIKYLSQFGWRPHVLTVSDGCYFAHDASLERDVPKDCPVTRTWSFEIERLAWLRRWRRQQSAPQNGSSALPSALHARTAGVLQRARSLMLPDAQVGWVPFAVTRALHICRTQHIDAVWTTSAPYSGHLVGLLLKRALGLPWIADFRDAWSDNPMGSLTYPHVHRWLEARVLNAADKVVAVTPDILRYLEGRTHGPRSKYHVIANGFDPDDFAAHTPSLRHPEAACDDNAPFVLTMTGSLYGKISAVPFYEGLSEFLALHPHARKNTQVRWVGQMDQRARAAGQAACSRLGLSQNVSHAGYVSHADALEAMRTADVLLLILFSGKGAAQVMTGKVFEYLATDRPILALAEGTAAASLVRQCRAGVVTHPENVAGIAQALAQLWQKRHEAWADGPERRAHLAPFGRQALTKQLAHLLDSVAEPAR